MMAKLCKYTMVYLWNILYKKSKKLKIKIPFFFIRGGLGIG